MVEEWQVAMIAIYTLILFVWIAILLWLQEKDIIAMLLLGLPILYLTFAILGTIYTPNIGLSIGNAACISISILISVPLLTWINRDIPVHLKRKYLRLSITAVIFALIAQFPLVVPSEYVVGHLRGLFECFALTLLCYAVYLVFLEQPDCIFDVDVTPKTSSKPV